MERAVFVAEAVCVCVCCLQLQAPWSVSSRGSEPAGPLEQARGALFSRRPKSGAPLRAARPGPSCPCSRRLP